MSGNAKRGSALYLATVFACVLLSYGGSLQAESPSASHAPQLSVNPTGPSGRYVLSVTDLLEYWRERVIAGHEFLTR